MYDFPVLLAAEWGHGDRLLQVLNRPDTPVSRQRLILTLLGETHVTRGYSILVEKLQDRRLAKEAAEALGFFGLQAQKHLLPILKDRSNPQLQEAVAKAPDMRAFPTLMQLEQQIWTNYSRDPHLQAFREAVDWSIREVKQGGHGDDF
jgi:hypothetical protein